MRRLRVIVPLLVVIAALIVGVVAWASNGSDNPEVITQAKKNCPPIARDDAAFTRPTEPVVVDVLANDTDADGDLLVFEALEVSEGTTSVDDGKTPTNAADDQLVYTPADAPGSSATVKYQVEDASGATSTAVITVAITDAGALPAGLESEPLSAPPDAPMEARCEGDVSEDLDDVTTTTGAATTSTLEAQSEDEDSSGLTPSPTAKRKPTTRSGTTTTTTVRRGTSTTSGGGGSPGSTTNTTQRTTTTTRPRSSTTSGPPPCTDRQSCEDYGNSFRSTTTQP